MSRVEEQRAAVRRPAPLRCWIIDAKAERFVQLADLSLSGARVLAAAPPEVGERVVLRFQLPTSSLPIVCRAHVVWRAEGFRGRGGVMGLAFESVSEVAALAAFIDDFAAPKAV
jgi:hypothetical protein